MARPLRGTTRRDSQSAAGRRPEAIRQFVSRIYALGFRSNAQGWTDLGQRCGDIVKDIPVELDAKGRLRRLVWRSGRVGGWLYTSLAALTGKGR